MTRLSRIDHLPGDVRVPAYDPAAHGEGIVHLGLGAFHKAHQAVYTDDALAASGGDWRIVGVSLRSSGAVDELTPQNGLYTVIAAGADSHEVRVIGALSRALAHAHGDAPAVNAALAAPETRIVTVTVTEKGYGLDRASGGVDTAHPAIAHDLEHPDAPVGVAGLILRGLKQRHAAGIAPFTVLCCDNLPGNGELLRGLILDLAARTAPELRDWIAAEVAFPSSMVDRITPAPGPDVREAAERALGAEDHAAVQTEAFSQWVIEDRFTGGRPEWEAGGALFVTDVAPYERMKLRMLNGTHSMLAYAGFHSGKRYVRDVMRDADLAALVRRHLSAAAATLDPLPGIDFEAYAAELAARFENPNLAHQTYQIAMDGTEKVPQRLFAPALDALERGQPTRPFAFAVAAWLRHCLARKDDGEVYELQDPRADEIATRLTEQDEAPAIVAAMFDLPGLVPDVLRQSDRFRDEVTDVLDAMLQGSVAGAVAREAAL
ncbi:mannitol dehydrogenase family protein [Tranquillimonas rosea]|uniref:mannitol dehydrogenase family protein n=1 Tax=Tranquillimonas rosea TaxID=641238 RepID=UPI003BAB43A1